MAKPTPWNDEYTLLCEKCGYVVEGLDTAGPCPECGKPIAESLPERRVGTPWQQEPGFKSLLRTWWMTLRHPLQTSNVMRFDGEYPLTPLSATLFYSIILCFVVLVLEPVVLPLEPRIADIWNIFFGFLMLTFLGIAIWTIFFALSLIEALRLRFFISRRGGRVDSSITWGIVGHGAVGWTLTGLIWILGWKIYQLVSYLNPTTSSYELRQQMERHITLIIEPAFYSGIIIGLLVFEIFVYLGIRRCKYANRIRPESDITEPTQSDTRTT